MLTNHEQSQDKRHTGDNAHIAALDSVDPPAPTPESPITAPSEPLPPKRKRRTFTLPDCAYDTLSAAAQTGDGNRSGLLERYILDAATSVALDTDAYATLLAAAAVAEVEPARLLARYIQAAPTSVDLDADAYAALLAAAAVAEVEPARLLARYIHDAATSVTLGAEVLTALETHAVAYGTEPATLLTELVERAGAILAWTQPAPPPPAPWWQFWRRTRPAAMDAGPALPPAR